MSYPVSVQTPQYDIDTLGGLKNLPLTGRCSRPIAGRPRDILAGAAATPSSRTTISVPAVNIYATTQGRDLGGVAADIQKIVDDIARGPAQRLDRRDSRPGRRR